MRKLPSEGGCWYCHDDCGPLLFSSEFDTYVHERCLREAIKEDSSDREAQIMAKELINDQKAR